MCVSGQKFVPNNSTEASRTLALNVQMLHVSVAHCFRLCVGQKHASQCNLNQINLNTIFDAVITFIKTTVVYINYSFIFMYLCDKEIFSILFKLCLMCKNRPQVIKVTITTRNKLQTKVTLVTW